MKYNDIIILKDKQSIQEAMKNDLNADGLKLLVEESKNYLLPAEKTINWEITSFQNSELFLIRRTVEGVPSLTQVGVFFRPDVFQSGSRSELIGRGFEWLFNEPENPNKYDVDDLVFANTIYNDDFEFSKVADSVGGKNWLITEWQCGHSDCENPRLFVLEDKNVVFLWQGVLMNENEIELFNRKEH